MKKIFSLAAAFIITLFVLPFGNTALADGEEYDDIKDGEYNITANALHDDEDKPSGAAGFIDEKATWSVHEGEIEFTITIPHNDMAEVTGLQIEGAKPTIDGEKWTYKLDKLTSTLSSQVQYEVPAMDMVGDEPFRFILEGLDDLPVTEDESTNDDTNEDDQDSDS